MPHIALLPMVRLWIQRLGEARLFLFLLGEFARVVPAAGIRWRGGEAVPVGSLVVCLVRITLSHGSAPFSDFTAWY
ncbi:hypothetical protein D3C73_1553130 [compost metagenome]